MSSIDPSENETLSTMEEVYLQREQLLSDARRKVAISNLLQHPGWEYIRKFWESRIESARLAMLRVDTSDKEVTADTVRKWRLREEQWSELVAFVDQALAFEGAEDVLLKEQLNVHE